MHALSACLAPRWFSHQNGQCTTAVHVRVSLKVTQVSMLACFLLNARNARALTETHSDNGVLLPSQKIANALGKPRLVAMLWPWPLRVRK